MILLTILFILCVVFIMLRWFSSTGPSKRFWPEYIDSFKSPPPCNKDDDCPRNRKCFQSKCYETLSPQQKCNPKTGFWEKTAAGDKLKCVCLRPHLVSQKISGFSCDVHINCSGPYGMVSASNPFECDCQRQFRMDPSSGQCVRKIESDRDVEITCLSGYLLSTSPEAKAVFHADYLAQFSRVARCLKTPCSFNVLNHNSPLYHGILEFTVRNSRRTCFCSCDPRFGLFGVRMKNADHYLIGDDDGSSDPKRYNACASIYKEEPKYPKPYGFDFYCYFYLKDKSKPVSFLVFHSLPKDGLVESFKGKSSIIIVDDSFPFTFDQQILQNHWPVYYRRRMCIEPRHGWHRLKCLMEASISTMDIKNCSDTPEKEFIEKDEAFINNVLQSHFVCRLPNYTQDGENPVVVNPFVVDYLDISGFSHGYHLKIAQEGKDNNWFVKPAPSPFFTHLDLDLDASLNLLQKKWKHVQKDRQLFIRSNIVTLFTG